MATGPKRLTARRERRKVVEGRRSLDRARYSVRPSNLNISVTKLIMTEGIGRGSVRGKRKEREEGTKEGSLKMVSVAVQWVVSITEFKPSSTALCTESLT